MTKARLAQSVEHETLNLGVVGSSPTLGDVFFEGCFNFVKKNMSEVGFEPTPSYEDQNTLLQSEARDP